MQNRTAAGTEHLLGKLGNLCYWLGACCPRQLGDKRQVKIQGYSGIKKQGELNSKKCTEETELPK